MCLTLSHSSKILTILIDEISKCKTSISTCHMLLKFLSSNDEYIQLQNPNNDLFGKIMMLLGLLMAWNLTVLLLERLITTNPW